MENFELAITVLLVILVMVCAYIAASWTFWRKQSKSRVQEWLESGHDGIQSSFSRGFVPEGQEGVPKITITPIQPRPDVEEELASHTDDEDMQSHDIQDINLGRLYFALQYDKQRSVLRVRLIRGEDIPMERDISATYVGVRLHPLRLHGEPVQPYETSINVSFQESYDFQLTQSELAQQTLDFHICRYDRFSRQVAIGDVFLALAELGAQGIDITKEVYLCRSIIHSPEALASHVKKSRLDSETGDDSNEDYKRTKVDRSSKGKEKAQSMWKIVQAALHKGSFRGISHSVSGQDSLFYWESMFSSGDGENVESSSMSPSKPTKVLYFSGLGTPLESPIIFNEPEKEIEVVEDAVSRGERSGSFIFPSTSKSADEEHGKDKSVEPESESLPSPLQISPAPEEYYTIVPITPFTPASPHKSHKPSDRATVSWRVPESFTSRGPDVVQALSDSYSDPRIITIANMRPNNQVRRKFDASVSRTSCDGITRERNKDEPRITKRKREKVRRETGHKTSSRKHMPPKLYKRKTFSRHTNHNKPKEECPDYQRRRPQKTFRIHAKQSRTLSSSSEDDLNFSARTQQFEEFEVFKRAMVFEAKDYQVPFVAPLKDRAQSDPSIGSQKTRQVRRAQRSSVSMSDVKDSHIDSSDVSSDFGEY